MARANIIKTAALLLAWPTAWSLVDTFLFRLPATAGMLTGFCWGVAVMLWSADRGWLDDPRL